MKENLKIFVNATLLFSVIGFVTYLLLITASFFGCCTGITQHVFHQVIIILSVAGVATFGICFYNNCYKTRQHHNKPWR